MKNYYDTPFFNRTLPAIWGCTIFFVSGLAMYAAVMKISNAVLVSLLIINLLLIFGFKSFHAHLEALSRRKRVTFTKLVVQGWNRTSVLSYDDYVWHDHHVRDAHWIQLNANKHLTLHAQLSMYRYHRRQYDRRKNK